MSEQNLSSVQKLDLCKYVLSHLSEQIKFADQKALVVLAVVSFLSGNLFVKVVELQKQKLCWCTVAIAFIAVFSNLLCLLYSLKVVYPRTKRMQEKESFGIVYWADVLSYSSLEKFQEGLRQMDEEHLLKNFTGEIYKVSTINSRKYNALQKSFLMAGISAIFSVVLFLFF